MIGLGLAALGRPGYINLGHADALADTSLDAMRANCHAVLDAAWAAGIRYFDAARSYGRAEEFLAEWLTTRAVYPEVASKWGYTYVADWQVSAPQHEVKDHSLARLNAQWDESRALLGPWLGLYQIHSATLESGVLDDVAVHRRLRGLGVKVGLSLSGPRQSDTLERALDLGIFDAVQATWNVLEPSVGPMLARARAAGMRVIIKEALGNGRVMLNERVRAVARRLSASPDAVGLAAVLRQPFVHVVLSGAANVAQLEANVRARQVLAAWPAELELHEVAMSAEAYWAERSRLAWN